MPGVGVGVGDGVTVRVFSESRGVMMMGVAVGAGGWRADGFNATIRLMDMLNTTITLSMMVKIR